MPTSLTEARERIIKLFTELMAEGVEIEITSYYGDAPSLELTVRGSKGREWLEIRSDEWWTQ